MKKSSWLNIWSLTIIMSMILFPVTSVFAAGTGFSTTITYQNVGMDIAHITILYYPEGQSTPISIARPDLPVGASATVSIGNLETTPASFQGSAVIKSDVEVAVLMTQIPTTVSVKARPLAGATTKGSASIWLLHIVKITGTAAIISVQNLDNSPANIKFTFYGGVNPVILNKNNTPIGGSAYVNLADLSDLPNLYAGSVLVESVRAGSSTPGKITGMALYSGGTSTDANSTESLTGGGTKLYMPVAMCNFMGGMASSYFVLNTDPVQSASVTVTYNTGKYETQSLASRTGRFFNACTPSGTVSGYSGYATIKSNGPLILAKGLIKNMGMSASFIGQSTGAERLAFPHAVYSTSKYATGLRSRTTISVMNLGGNLAAGAVKAKYFGKDGKLIGTYSFPAFVSGVKIDTNAAQLGATGAEFGYYSDGTTGGSVILEGPVGSSLMAVGWVINVVSAGVYSGEMYNGISPNGTP
jgi:hypothetical protein